MSNMIYNFPPAIHYGWGEAKRIGGYIRDLHANQVLIVTDKGVERAGLLARVEASLLRERISFVVYNSVQPNPTDRNVEEGLEVYRENGCDVVVAVGGGSPMDAAKGIVLTATHPGSLGDYYRDTEPMRLITSDVPGFVAVPTTSGTGSEVSRGAIITDTSQNRKRGISSRYLLPKVVVLDPELTVSMPPMLTAHTGLDALSHSIEAFAVDVYAPLADAFAKEGMRLVAASLMRAYEDGSDRRAREDMMMASTLGALAFQKGLGAVHSLAHPLSTQTDMSHGAACGILLPHVIRFNMAEEPSKSRVTKKYAEIARILSVDISGRTVKEAAEKAAEAVQKLLERLSVPLRLRDWGVNEENIKVMARNAMLDHCHPRNPRACTKADITALYEAAF